MAGLLRFVTRSRYHAVGVSALSLLLPPFSFVAAAIIGLATLRYGAGEGAVVLAGSAVVFAVAMWGFAMSAAPVVVFVAVTGLPALALCALLQATSSQLAASQPISYRVNALCALLRATSSQGLVLAAATLAAGASITALYLLVTDPVAWWTALLRDFFTARGGDVDPQSLDPIVGLLAPMITGLPVAVVVTTMAAVFLARWGHAMLDNPGGFGREFRELRLGRRFAAGAGLVAAVALFAAPRGGGLGHDLLILLVASYAIQGIALVHALVALRGGARGWLIAMYASLLLMPVTVLALSVAGFSDDWLDYRTRFGRPR